MPNLDGLTQEQINSFINTGILPQKPKMDNVNTPFFVLQTSLTTVDGMQWKYLDHQIIPKHAQIAGTMDYMYKMLKNYFAEHPTSEYPGGRVQILYVSPEDGTCLPYGEAMNYTAPKRVFVNGPNKSSELKQLLEKKIKVVQAEQAQLALDAISNTSITGFYGNLTQPFGSNNF